MSNTQTQPPSTTRTEDGWKQHPQFPFIHLNRHTGQVRNTNTGNLIGSKPAKGKRPFFTVSVRCDHGKAVKHSCNLARAILLTFVGPAPTRGHEASHLNHDPSDCRLENLKWETRKANLSRRTAPPDGALHHHSKLGVWDAYSIYRQYHRKVLSLGKLEKKYGLTKGAIHQLVTGKTWKSYQAQFAELVRQGVEVFPGSSEPTPEPTPEPVQVIAKAKPKALIRPTKPDLQTLTEELSPDREQALTERHDEELYRGLKEAQKQAWKLDEPEDKAQKLDTETPPQEDTPAPTSTHRRSKRFAWNKEDLAQAETQPQAPTPAPAPSQTPAPRKSRRF